MKSTETPLQNGRFITFEGIDGAGKSTHIEFVTTLLQGGGREVVVTREPGGTVLGEKLRTLLLSEKMHLETEALLMFAARREHIAQVIEPALSRGAWVLSDRFTDASFAYQGGGRGLPTEKLLSLENWVHPDLHPDITFLFDLPPKEASARLEASRARDRFESEKRDFFERVRSEYLRRAGEFPARFRIIDSTKSISAIEDKLREILCAWLA